MPGLTLPYIRPPISFFRSHTFISSRIHYLPPLFVCLFIYLLLLLLLSLSLSLSLSSILSLLFLLSYRIIPGPKNLIQACDVTIICATFPPQYSDVSPKLIHRVRSIADGIKLYFDQGHNIHCG